MKIEEFEYLIGMSTEQATLDFQAKSTNLAILVTGEDGVYNFDLSSITQPTLCVEIVDGEIVRIARLIN